MQTCNILLDVASIARIVFSNCWYFITIGSNLRDCKFQISIFRGTVWECWLRMQPCVWAPWNKTTALALYANASRCGRVCTCVVSWPCSCVLMSVSLCVSELLFFISCLCLFHVCMPVPLSFFICLVFVRLRSFDYSSLCLCLSVFVVVCCCWQFVFCAYSYISFHVFFYRSPFVPRALYFCWYTNFRWNTFW